MKRTSLRLLSPLSLTLVAAAAASCGRSHQESEPLDAHRLYAFSSCDDMMSYVRATAMDMALADGIGLDDLGVTPGVDPAGDDGAEDGDSNGGDPPGHSDTNVQEAGVDEPDLVKTDGTRIIALARGRLYAIDANDVVPVLRGQVQLPAGWDHQLFLHGTRALVISHSTAWDSDAPVLPPQWQGENDWVELTQLTEVDLTDLANPTVVRTVYAGGGFVSARSIGSTVRLVLRSYPVGVDVRSWWEFLYDDGDPDVEPPGGDPGDPGSETDGGEDPPPDETGDVGPDDPDPDTGEEEDGRSGSAVGIDRRVPLARRAAIASKRAQQLRGGVDEDFERAKAEAKAKAKAHNEQVLAASKPSDWLPLYATSNGATASLVECEESMRPGVASGLGLLSVVTIDLATGIEPGTAAGVFSSGEIVYSSPNTLYVATHPWYTVDVQSDGEVEPDEVEPGIPDDPQDDVTEDPAETGTGEEAFAAMQPRFAPTEPTDTYVSYVHAFDISDPQSVAYEASGQVSGFLLNQFSMSEYQGDLRVASTGVEWADVDGTQSYVTVLRPDGDVLEQIGRVGNLGRGERIYAVRFLGDMGYVVTFRQVDPLYTIDLKQPTAPTVLGELKINGYSAYLHPVGPGLLIGVGQDATSEGQTLGTQLSLFDVSNPALPVRLHNFTVADAYSDAEFDHHAFLYWPATKTTVLPIRRYAWDDDSQTDDSFQGALVFNVDPVAGITLAGTIEHPEPEWGGDWDGGDGDGEDKPGDGDGDTVPDPVGAMPVRSLVIGDGLHTLSSAGLETSGLAALEHRSWLSFGQ